MILISYFRFVPHFKERSDEKSLFDCADQAHRSERISLRGTIHRDRLFSDLQRPAVEESPLARVCQAQLS